MYNIIPKEQFDISYVNKNAKIVIVGLSPGPTGIKNYNLNNNNQENNRICAFSGEPLRTNMITMLNSIHVNKILNIKDCKSIWSDDFDKVSMTSVLKQSVLKNGKFISSIKYNEIQKNDELSTLFKGFKSDCKNYKNAKLFVACGPRVKEILDKLVEEKIITVPVIGIAHPAGSNNGRVIAYLKMMNKNGDKSTENAILLRRDADLKIQTLLNK